MPKKWSFVVFSILCCCSSITWAAQNTTETNRLFAPSLAQKFYEIAYELANSKDINGPEFAQAVAFLTAALELDSRASYVHPTLIKLIARHPAAEQDYSGLVYNSLAKYLNKNSDFEPAQQAVQYILERMNVREHREQMLTYLLQNLSGKNACFDSELTTLLGLLSAEKADVSAAQYYFIQAFNRDKYNKLAFDKLAEFVPAEQISPPVYLEHLRLMLGKNLFDLEAALAFAQYAEQIQLYQTAADAYDYCARLFAYLYPSQQLPPSIYLPWMLNNYNAPRSQDNCLKIAAQLRQNGIFDIFAEALAAKAAMKIANLEQANQILQSVEGEINNQSSIPVPSGAEGINNQSIAWFYSFASPDANKALDWANRAYASEPNSPSAAALLAYSLVMNEQKDWAKTILENYEQNQIAVLTLALVQLAEGQKDSAIETLKSAIAKNPGSLEAEHAKKILTGIGGTYVPPSDPNITLMALRTTFTTNLVPSFITPDKILSAQLNLRGTEFSYGSSLEGSVAIINNSAEPLLISDDSLFTGNIRIDADVTGDLNKIIPNLASTKIRPPAPIAPGSSFFVPLPVFTGELRRLLLTHPQASFNIQFTLYLDPVTDDQGRVTSRIPGLKPAVVTVKRQKTEIVDKFLRNRIGSLAKGQQGQKIKTAHLFIGLLLEQNAMAGIQPPYDFAYTDSMPALLNSALLHSLTYDDWSVKTQIMTDMTLLPLDYQFINALSENLNDTRWPTRLMALYLLGKNQKDTFTPVLDWTAQYDSSRFVCDMAVALGGTYIPPQQPRPAQAGSQQQNAQNQPQR
ncbi:MAG: CDC27 family protein [Sedimentisphaerales bacterium]|nr:CDC27 family protein [Sedimentisphaerales bacterium]